MNHAETLNLGAVDRAPYRLSHLLREMPAGFSAHRPVAERDREHIEKVGQHAENANDTLMHGLQALGHVIMNAALNEEGGVEAHHLARLGDLITHLAVEAEAMQELIWSTDSALQRSAWTAVRPGQMPPPEKRVIGWHTELDSACVIYYDISGPSEPCWRVCADGGEFPIDAITHWQSLIHPIFE